MKPVEENIPATPPLSATVAPILHSTVHMNAIDRGTTLNNGAADAAGR